MLGIWLVRTIAFFFAPTDNYLLFYREDSNNLHSIENNIKESLAIVNCWLIDNILCINSSETNAVLFNSRRAGSFNFNIKIYMYSNDLVDSMQCVRVTLDRDLNFDTHIGNVKFAVPSKNCNLNLYLPLTFKHIVAHFFLMMHEWCIDVFSACLRYNLDKLESVVNRITSFVYSDMLRDYISPVVLAFLKFSLSDYLCTSPKLFKPDSQTIQLNDSKFIYYIINTIIVKLISRTIFYCSRC